MLMPAEDSATPDAALMKKRWLQALEEEALQKLALLARSNAHAPELKLVEGAARGAVSELAGYAGMLLLALPA